MSNFEQAVKVVLKHEGGLVNHPDDPGGITHFGISLRFLHSTQEYKNVDADFVRYLTEDQAKEIYKKYWWDKYNYGQFSQSLATKIFDLSVNMGARQAHKLLQRACRSVGFVLVDDGLIGPKSLAVIDKITENGQVPELVAALRSEAAGFYRLLVEQKPSFKSFIRGWLRRAYS